MVLSSELLSSTRYVKRPLMFRERLRLWDYPGYITQRMNGYQLRLLWTYIYPTPPTKVLASVLEVVMGAHPLGQKISREVLNVGIQIEETGSKDTNTIFTI